MTLNAHSENEMHKHENCLMFKLAGEISKGMEQNEISKPLKYCLNNLLKIN